MHARVVRFEGGDADRVRQTIDDIRQRGEEAGGPPEGVPAVGVLMLRKPDGSEVLAITLYATEDDLKQGDATLNSMEPPDPGGLGQKSGVEHYEVGFKADAPEAST